MTGPSPFKPALERAASHALAHLESLERVPVSASATLEELGTRLDRPLTDEGNDAVRVIDDLVMDAAGGIVQSPGGRFFGWVIGGSVPAALAADWLVSAWDQNAAFKPVAPPRR